MGGTSTGLGTHLELFFRGRLFFSHPLNTWTNFSHPLNFVSFFSHPLILMHFFTPLISVPNAFSYPLNTQFFDGKGVQCACPPDWKLKEDGLTCEISKLQFYQCKSIWAATIRGFI